MRVEEHWDDISININIIQFLFVGVVVNDKGVEVVRAPNKGILN